MKKINEKIHGIRETIKDLAALKYYGGRYGEYQGAIIVDRQEGEIVGVLFDHNARLIQEDRPTGVYDELMMCPDGSALTHKSVYYVDDKPKMQEIKNYYFRGNAEGHAAEKYEDVMARQEAESEEIRKEVEEKEAQEAADILASWGRGK